MYFAKSGITTSVPVLPNSLGINIRQSITSATTKVIATPASIGIIGVFSATGCSFSSVGCSGVVSTTSATYFVGSVSTKVEYSKVMAGSFLNSSKLHSISDAEW